MEFLLYSLLKHGIRKPQRHDGMIGFHMIGIEFPINFDRETLPIRTVSLLFSGMIGKKTKGDESMQKYKKILYALLLSFSLINTTPIYASEYTEFVNNLVYLRDLNTTNDGNHLKEINGYSYIVDKNDNICYGYSYDEYGNLYYTEENSTTGILKSNVNQDGIWFDENGIYTNPSTIEIDKNKALSEEFEQTGSVTFNSNEEVLNFLEYYSIQYRLYDEVFNYPIQNKSTSENGISTETHTITMPNESKYDRNAVLNNIHNTFIPLRGDTPYEKLFDVCKQIKETMTYDLDYQHADLETAIINKRGVCWHYAKIAKVLLEDAGIQTEIMMGNLNGNGHMWIRCFIDGKWCYVDPTATQTSWWDYSNLPYNKFIKEYLPLRYITIKEP